MINIRENQSLLEHNTFGIQAKARWFVEYDSCEDIRQFVANGMLKANPYFHIGSGSNLLFTGDYKGVILHSAIKGICVVDENDESYFLSVGAGEIWDDFVAYCVSHNMYGVENLSLIPGEVGAAAVQNIGAYGAEVKDVIREIEVIGVEGKSQTIAATDAHYDYRESMFKHTKNMFVTRVLFELKKTPCYRLDYGSIQSELAKYGEINLANIRKAIITIRQNKLPDPEITGNAGSFFKNPIISRKRFEEIQSQYPQMPFYDLGNSVKVPAGWMIEQCGWKGKTLGKAGVHDKQALVLINLGGASGSDVVTLCNTIRKDVINKFGIDLSPEVNFI